MTPPLLTIVLFIWAWNAIDNYVLRPVETGIRMLLVVSMKDIHEVPPADAVPLHVGQPTNQGFVYRSVSYVPGPNGKRFLPQYVVQYVDEHLDRLDPYEPAPASAMAYWHHYVDMVYLPRHMVVPIFLVVFVILLYFLGKLFAQGVGRVMVVGVESFIGRLPLVSKVYGSVKQVSDFLFSDRQIEFNRVVAVEYPRKGVWSIGFVTGQSMFDISAAANEPVLSVLIPCSPIPVTGCVITVRRSEALDLNLTIDQAVQYIVSCGVVIPSHQMAQINNSQPTLPTR